MTDPNWTAYFDQVEAVAADVARAHHDLEAGAHDQPTPAAAEHLHAQWLAAPLRPGCPHLDPERPQPVVGFLSNPGMIYCAECAATVRQLLARRPMCDLCACDRTDVGLVFRLGDAGHLIGYACDECAA